MKGKWFKVFIILIIAAFAGAFFFFDLGHYLTLVYFKSQHQVFADYYSANQGVVILIYMAIYIVVTALSLPGAIVMTLVGGALFGLVVGTIVISFASTIGATLAFLVSRYLLGDWVQNRFGDKLAAINKGMEKDGAFYLFTLRLVPLFPFFVINLLMGLTRIKTLRYYLVSQIGMLAGTIVYVNAGVQIARINSLSGIMSHELVASFAVLGIFPLLSKKFVSLFKSRKILRK